MNGIFALKVLYMPRPFLGSSRPLIFWNSVVVDDHATSLRSPQTITGSSIFSTSFPTMRSSASRSVDSGASVGDGGSGCTQYSQTVCPVSSSRRTRIDGVSSFIRNLVSPSSS
jgi:hypothetical protein